MTGEPSADPEALAAEHRRLGVKAANHKQQVRVHRAGLRAAKERQAEIERMCARLGIQLTLQPGVGGIHGRSTSDA